MASFVVAVIFIQTCLNLSSASHHGELKSPFRMEFKRKHFHGERPYAIEPADQLDARDIELAKAAFDVQDDAENERVKGDLQLGEEINKITSQNTYFGPRFSDNDEEPLIKDGALRSSITKPRKHGKRKIVKKHIQKKTHHHKTAARKNQNKKRKLTHKLSKKVKTSRTQKKSTVKKTYKKKERTHAKNAKKRAGTHHKHESTSTHKKLPALKKFYAKDYGDNGDDYIENYKPEEKEEGFDRFKNDHSEEDNIIDKMREHAGYGDSESDDDRFDDGKSGSFSRDNDDKSSFSNENDDKSGFSREEEENEEKEDQQDEEEAERDAQQEDNDEDDDKDEDEIDEAKNVNSDNEEEDQGVIKQTNDKMEVADNGLVFNQETGTINENLLKKDPSFGHNNGDTFVDDEMRNSGIDKKSKNGRMQKQGRRKIKAAGKTASLKLASKPKAANKIKVVPVADQIRILKKLAVKAKAKPTEVKASKKSDLLRRNYDNDSEDADNDKENEERYNEDLW